MTDEEIKKANHALVIIGKYLFLQLLLMSLITINTNNNGLTIRVMLFILVIGYTTFSAIAEMRASNIK